MIFSPSHGLTPSTVYTRMTKKDPFADLEKLRASLPVGPAPTATTPQRRSPARAVVRMERKGRGGKEVTIIEKLELPERELGDWCRALKAALGCGGTIEGDTICLQGDLRQRVPAILTARGVGKVTVG